MIIVMEYFDAGFSPLYNSFDWLIMKTNHYTLDIELAGVPIRILSRERTWVGVFREYVTDKAPAIIIEPDDEDLERARQELDATNAIRKRSFGDHYGGFFLEHTAIHMLITEKLIPHDVLVVHGSSFCIDGRAYLITGPSGEGKSTHTRLWRDAFGNRVRVINDDKPMLRVEGPEVLVYGNPWQGKHCLGSNIMAPLKAVVRIHRGKHSRIDPLPKASAYQELLQQIPLSRDAALVSHELELAKSIVQSVDFYAASCTMNPESMQVVADVIMNA